MDERHERAVAVVGLGAILPDAPTAPAFWRNLCEKRYSITEVPPGRWSVADYYDADPAAPDKSYSKIGSWVRGFSFDWKRFHVPPRVASSMDEGQQWAVTIAAEALADYGYPDRPLDLERTGVVLGTAMGGELHYATHLRVAFPEYVRALSAVQQFADLPADMRAAILEQWQQRIGSVLPPITEDSMPGELPNVMTGRIANVLNLRGPNFITDAACASSFAATDAAMNLLVNRHCDAVLTGGVDRNMGVSTFVKFCKIGALSATGTRPFGDGADGFVMGEGCAAFLLKRLADAERDGDRIYAVIRGIAGSSDGKGKGITAPNPVGQKLACERAWRDAGLDPATATLVEAHGTSTRVGDVVEVESLGSIFKGAPRGSIAFGSAKSNVGHLKAGAGAAGLLKTVYAIHNRMLPPTLNAERPNPAIDFSAVPFALSHELREWKRSNGTPRRAGVSAYGFGGTNFHLVLEEHRPGELTTRKPMVSVTDRTSGPSPSGLRGGKAPLRGIAMLGADSAAALKERLEDLLTRVRDGALPPVAPPDPAALAARERIAIDFGTREELIDKLTKTERAMGFDTAQAWKALQAQGIFRGSGPRTGKLAFLFPGQGSQWLNMGKELAAIEPVVARTFAEADAVMTPVLGGRSLSSYVFVDGNDLAAVERSEEALRQTAITQPAMLTVDEAIRRLLGEYDFEPDYAMGHSLGEYAALVASGVMPFADAVEASAARGREMTVLSMEDNGWMAAVMAPPEAVQEVLRSIDGYVVAANINSRTQCVVGGETDAVQRAIDVFTAKGIQAIRLPVSHAFHTRIVALASKPLGVLLDRLQISPPTRQMVANVTGGLYPSAVPEIKALLMQQIAAPVQWVKGLETLYAEGVRTFVEVGPKKALKGFTDDVLGDKPDVVSLFTNHPKPGEIITFNHALCGLYAAGWGVPAARDIVVSSEPVTMAVPAPALAAAPPPSVSAASVRTAPPASSSFSPHGAGSLDTTIMSTAPETGAYTALAQMLTQALSTMSAGHRGIDDRNDVPRGSIVVSGCGIGLPGAEKPVMDPQNVERILRGEQFVDLVPERFRVQMARKHVTRVVKSEDGGGSFETIDDTADVIKLAGRSGPFDLTEEYGVPDRLVEALDTTTQLAMAAGLDALREAGIPLVQSFKKTTTGKFLPDRWMLPESMRDETGVIFASAFPGLDRFADEAERYYRYEERLTRRELLEDLRRYTRDPETLREIQRRQAELEAELQRAPYGFDRRFLLRVLPMGHSQFAEFIGARGPNTQVNAACASTAQAIGLAEDWIRSGRCRRVVVVGGDNVTSEHLLGWMGAGFLASGAAATDDKVSDAAIPFDRRRHGTILGMGACGLVVESEDAVRERGMRGIVEVLSSETSNSAFHATRLDVEHVSAVVDSLITSAERRFGLSRQQMAPETVFVSHETFTPARGGSASAEVAALRRVFGDAASEIVIANTKGFTGHPMGVGIEDVIAVKILEHGIVPPVPNLKEVDPELGPLNLSRGGRYPVKYALHLAAGFGSQIALALFRRIPGGLDRMDNRALYDRWIADVSGHDRADTEIAKRVLRVVSQGAPVRQPAPSRWTFGLGPTLRAAAPGDGRYGERPMPMVVPTPTFAPERVRGEAAASPGHRQAAAPAPAPTVAATPARAPEAAPATAPAAPAPPPPAPAAAAPVVDTVATQVLEIVAGKTGYPPDMLDMDLDLEADLGVDTVKQAETFAAVREAFTIPRVENLKLRDFPTLRHVVQFVYDNRPDLAAAKRAAVAPTPAAPVAAPAAAPTSGAAPSAAVDPVTSQVLGIVAAKTGYPPDMLDMDLDLEADLGVDTVKQAETFAAVREAFSIPRVENLKLRDFPTLRHVVGFVFTHRPDLAAAKAAPAPAATPAPAPAPTVASAASTTPAAPHAVAKAADPAAERVLAIVAEKTGYPPEMLEMDLDLEADLGVDTVKQAETFASVREAFSIPRVENLKLRDFPTLRHVVQFVYDNRPDLAAAQAAPAAPAAAAAPSVAPTATATPPPAAPQVPADPITEKVLAIVAEKTGYPPEMLEMDLDLEADLGVDTVKQAETFASVREAFSIPRVESLKLRDFPTLRHVVGFVLTHRPDLAQAAAPAQSAPVAAPEASATAAGPASVAPASEAPAPAAWPASIRLEDADRAPRRVATPAVRPPLAFCKETGAMLGAGSRVVVAHDDDGVGPALEALLTARGVAVLGLPAGTDGNELRRRLEAWLADGPIHGVFWLPALDVEPSLTSLDVATFRSLARRRIKRLADVMRALYDQVSGEGRFLVAATRMGGLHGQGPDGATAPLGGGVAGFAKAYKRERMTTLVKVADFTALASAEEIANLLLEEARLDPGVVEVGYRDGLRWAITLDERPANDGGQGLSLGRDTVFVVTGAAGGITSAIVADLAQASGGTFYLLDLVAKPEAGDQKIALLRQDRERLKFALIDEMKARGKKPTPVAIDKQLMAIERDEAALRAIQVVEAAGGAAHYRSVDLLDASAIEAVVQEIRERHGRIDVLMHAGGIEISKILSEKSAQEFDRVFDIKAEGFFNLLKAAHDLPIAATVVFSSVAGRFGNGGQTDYSAANAFLCAVSRYLRCVRPGTRAIAIDWSAWGGIGMATRGSIPKVMEAAGIEMLAPEVGIPTVRRELTAGATADEIVVGGRLGVLVEEWDPTGGLDPDKVRAWLAASERPRLMVGAVSAAPLYGGLSVETVLDPQAQPFLFDHQIEGTPVLPGVMGTEAFAQLAGFMAPDWAVSGVEEVQFLMPFKFFRMQPGTLHLTANGRPDPSGDLVVAVTLRSRVQARPELPMQERVHFRGQVRLSRAQPIAPRPRPLPEFGGRLVGRDSIYRIYFHGPAYRVLDEVRLGPDGAIGTMTEQLPPDTDPSGARLVMAPRLIELCFQTAGILEAANKEVLGLPTAMRVATTYRDAESANGRRLFAVVHINGAPDEYDARVVDDEGNVYVEIQGYKTIALPGRATIGE